MRTRVLVACVIATLISPACAAENGGAERRPGAGLERLSRAAVLDGPRVKPLGVLAEELAPCTGTAESPGVPRGQRALLALIITDSIPYFQKVGFSFLRLDLLPLDGAWFSAADVRAIEAHSPPHPPPAAEALQFAALVEEVSSAAASGSAVALDEAAWELAAFLEKRYGVEGVDTAQLAAESALSRLRPFVICALLYLIVGVLVALADRLPAWLSFAALAVAAIANLAAISFYGYVAGRVPVNNTYEGLLVLSGALGLVGLAACTRKVLRAAAPLAAFCACAVLAVAEFAGVKRGITPPVPVLQSLWLQVHVLTCFVGYAGFAVAFAASLVVVYSREERRSRYDYLAYRAVLFGFVFLSVGILTGAAWARQAWGRYWGFDPKETWALVTWLVYAAYLHLGLLGGRKEVTRAVAAIAGFVVVIFTFFGVNYLLSGLHSYA